VSPPYAPESPNGGASWGAGTLGEGGGSGPVLLSRCTLIGSGALSVQAKWVSPDMLEL
jgi:hypothetical protein